MDTQVSVVFLCINNEHMTTEIKHVKLFAITEKKGDCLDVKIYIYKTFTGLVRWQLNNAAEWY